LGGGNTKGLQSKRGVFLYQKKNSCDQTIRRASQQQKGILPLPEEGVPEEGFRCRHPFTKNIGFFMSKRRGKKVSYVRVG